MPTSLPLQAVPSASNPSTVTTAGNWPNLWCVGADCEREVSSSRMCCTVPSTAAGVDVAPFPCSQRRSKLCLLARVATIVPVTPIQAAGKGRHVVPSTLDNSNGHGRHMDGNTTASGPTRGWLWALSVMNGKEGDGARLPRVSNLTPTYITQERGGSLSIQDLSWVLKIALIFTPASLCRRISLMRYNLTPSSPLVSPPVCSFLLLSVV